MSVYKRCCIHTSNLLTIFWERHVRVSFVMLPMALLAFTFQSFKASLTVFIHAFFIKTPHKVSDIRSGDIGRSNSLEIFLLQTIPWRVQRHFAESIDFRVVSARSRAPYIVRLHMKLGYNEECCILGCDGL
jgi:hypothetical protein